MDFSPLRAYLGLPRPTWTLKWFILRLPGPTWAHVSLSGSVWGNLGPNILHFRPPRAYLGPCGPLWTYLGLSGPIWSFLGYLLKPRALRT